MHAWVCPGLRAFMCVHVQACRCVYVYTLVHLCLCIYDCFYLSILCMFLVFYILSFPHSSSKESVCSAGDLGLIPGSGRSSGKGNDNPLQCSCLENPMDRGTWWATVHRVARVRHDLATKERERVICSLYTTYDNLSFNES